MINEIDKLLAESPPCIPDELRAQLTTFLGEVSKHGVVMVGFLFRPEPLAVEHYMNQPMTKQEYVRTMLDLVGVVNAMDNRTQEIKSPNLVALAEA